jgi:hypothetical protein
VHTGRLTGADKIDERIGKVIGKHKVAKHFLREVTDTTFTYRRDEDKIRTEAALDGIYVIRISVTDEALNSAEAVTADKNLSTSNGTFTSSKPMTWICGPSITTWTSASAFTC